MKEEELSQKAQEEQRLRDLKANEEESRIREYARYHALKLYQSFTSTPKFLAVVYYAWRNDGEIQFCKYTKPNVDIVGSASGIELREPLRVYVDGYSDAEFLSEEQLAHIRRAEWEIKSRNESDKRSMMALAKADLLAKERSSEFEI